MKLRRVFARCKCWWSWGGVPSIEHDCPRHGHLRRLPRPGLSPLPATSKEYDLGWIDGYNHAKSESLQLRRLYPGQGSSA